jgi:outer membrane protein OmpA-like peptidoglycan-associated protein
MKIAINGHTDNIGKPADNLLLSEKRAASVLAFLISKNIQSDRISSFGFGESKPLTSNDSEENRAINRRVEFSILAP